MTRLEQRRWTERRCFAILEDGLQVEEKTLFSRMTYCVPFEAIPDDPFTIASSSRLWFSLAALCIALAIVLHPLLALTVPICVGVWWHSRRAYVGLRCGRQLVLFHEAPA